MRELKYIAGGIGTTWLGWKIAETRPDLGGLVFVTGVFLLSHPLRSA